LDFKVRWHHSMAPLASSASPSGEIASYISRLPAIEASDAPLVRLPDDTVAGQYRGHRLSSVFLPVFGCDGGVAGHAAALRIWKQDAAEISPQGLFAITRDDDDLVYLDRLVRAVHAINYFRHAPESFRLFLEVQARLLAAVPDQHGRAFQRVLNAVGVSTNRVVIALPASANEHPLLLTAVSANYRFHGYQVAVTLPASGETNDLPPAEETPDALFDRFGYCKPDIVRFPLPSAEAFDYASQLARRLHGAARLMATGVDDQQALAAARSAKVDLLQGRVLDADEARSAPLETSFHR
jgi:EAL domain-containing protein (putative c-di-GMP-specific phosphodiesterase class I)